jgi:hypothetical protein
MKAGVDTSTLAHQMSGSGACMDSRPSPILARLRAAAGRVDTNASRKWVGELASYLDRIEVTSH